MQCHSPSCIPAGNVLEYNATELALSTGNFRLERVELAVFTRESWTTLHLQWSFMVRSVSFTCFHESPPKEFVMTHYKTISLAVDWTWKVALTMRCSHSPGMSVVRASPLIVSPLVMTLFPFSFQHPNLIQLIGYCSAPPALIFPFMERLSLYNCLRLQSMKHGSLQTETTYLFGSMFLLLIVMYPFCFKLPGWSSTILVCEQKHPQGFSMWPGLPALLCPSIHTSWR